MNEGGLYENLNEFEGWYTVRILLIYQLNELCCLYSAIHELSNILSSR